MIKVGLCGFTVAMGEYSLSFPVVEVQQTFYEPPSDAVLQRWMASTRGVPPRRALEFTVKAWQLITHEAKSPTYRRLKRPLSAEERATCGAFRDSAIVRGAFDRTLACARALSATAILFQCPASFTPDDVNIERLRLFFERVANPARPPGLRYLWEPRGPAWVRAREVALRLCTQLGLVYAVDPFVTAPDPESGLAYYRLHGLTGARHVYSEAELRRLVGMTPDNAYVMFNNIPRVADARRFQDLLRAAGRSSDASFEQ